MRGIPALLRSGTRGSEVRSTSSIRRFRYLETESAKDGKRMGEMTLAEMDLYWERAKNL